MASQEYAEKKSGPTIQTGRARWNSKQWSGDERDEQGLIIALNCRLWGRDRVE
jgi:hypothetical protein